MKIWSLVFLLACFLFLSCGIREREEALEQRENEINQKEQSLLLLQKQLQLKEEDLLRRQKIIDSVRLLASQDSSFIPPQLTGKWSVTMRCTVTTCDGSAVGDVKNEQWDIAYQDRNIIVKAMADGQLVRTYTGAFQENKVQLTAQQDPGAPPVKMVVQLGFRSDTEMEGEREITRANNCRIVYAISMNKQ